MPKIAVVYLARLVEGFANFEAFAQSYRDHPAGEPHDLIIVCKGFTAAGHFLAIDVIFAGIPHQTLAVDDSIGLDLHAYKVAANKFDCEYFCFLNTYTKILSDDWLKKLFSNLSSCDVGLVGASGSYESLYNSFKVLNCIVWCVTSNIASTLSCDVLRSFSWMLPAFKQTIAGPKNFYRRKRRALADALSQRPSMLERYDGVWSDVISLKGPYSPLREFPRFPNPSIRTNVFMVRRDDFLAVPLEDHGADKSGCTEFESGHNGLSHYFLRKGLRLVAVGADGVGYNIEQWPTCGGFRSGNQSNLLASDNRTQDYDAMTPEVRATHLTMTWGGYLPGAPSNASLLGVSFSSERRVSEICRPLVRNQACNRLFSVAIPTHNGLSVVLDAIKTVIHQNYHNWEVVVFDNASTEPVETAVRALGDPRIRCERSEELLPVTESWNCALDLARGDYVTLMGNDDGLAPGFFDRLSKLADYFDEPDAIFSSLYQFMHPGASPGNRAGFVSELRMASFFEDREYPFLIDGETARRAVDGSLQMRRSFKCDLPAFTVARPFLDSIRHEGKVLHSPLPDCYFSNLVLEKAKKIVGEPKPLAFQGVSLASFGSKMNNHRTEVGCKALGHDPQKDPLLAHVTRQLLPGAPYNSQFILTMAHLARRIDDSSRQPDFSRYRRIQIAQWIKAHGSLKQSRTTPEGRAFWSLLSHREKIWAHKMGFLRRLASRVWRGFDGRLDRAASQYAFQPAQVFFNIGDYLNGFEVFRALEQGCVTRRAWPVSTD